jgi:hypothetical protein
MTVEELIAVLLTHHPTTTVKIADAEWGPCDITNVRVLTAIEQLESVNAPARARRGLTPESFEPQVVIE